MSMFRNLWNTIKSRERSRNRSRNRNQSGNREPSRVQSDTRDTQSRHSSHSREISRVKSAPCENTTCVIPPAVEYLPTCVIATLPEDPLAEVEKPQKSSDTKSDSLLTFFRRKARDRHTEHSPNNIKLERSSHSSGTTTNSRDLEAFSDMFTYLREDPSTTSSTSLHIENYTTFVSDLKEKREESIKSVCSFSKDPEDVECPDQESAPADRFKTITIRTLSKATRDELINELIEDAESLAVLHNEVQIHDTRLDDYP